MNQTHFYQTIVFGLGFLLLIGGGYLIKNIDNAGVLTKTLQTATSTDTAESADGATSTERIGVEGTYLCDVDSGCKDPVVLAIREGGEVSMTTTYAEGAEIQEELGTWKRGQDRSLVVLITGTANDTYPDPHSFSVRYVTSSSLSGLTFDASLFKDWTRPVFRRQENQE